MRAKRESPLAAALKAQALLLHLSFEYEARAHAKIPTAERLKEFTPSIRRRSRKRQQE